MNRIIRRVVYGYSSSHLCGGSVRCYWKSRDRKWRNRKWRHSHALSGGMLCACATGSCTISTLMGPFSSEVTKSRDRKYVLRMPGFFARFFITKVIVQFWSEVTSDWRHRKRLCPEVYSAYTRFFPRFVLVVVVQNVGCGVLYDVRVLWP